jgi:putrescine transport system substrate-binding protein
MWTMWVDSLGIPITAPNKKNAHKLMSFLMRPEITASITNHSEILVNIKKAKKFYNKEIKKNKQILPEELDIQKLVLGHIISNGRDISLQKFIPEQITLDR